MENFVNHHHNFGKGHLLILFELIVQKTLSDLIFAMSNLVLGSRVMCGH